MAKKNTLHNLPGLAFTDPVIKPFKVADNNGNWKIERPLFRWCRVNKDHAEEEAKLMNVAYQIALLDIAAKRPDALAMLKKMKTMKASIEKQTANIKF